MKTTTEDTHPVPTWRSDKCSYKSVMGLFYRLYGFFLSVMRLSWGLNCDRH